MVARRDTRCLGSAGSKRFELVDQRGAQSVVMRERGKGECAVPGGHLRVVDGRTVLVGTGDKVFRNPFAHFLRRQARGPVAEIGIFLREHSCVQGDDKDQTETIEPVHFSGLRDGVTDLSTVML